ncbi:MAG: tetratricopeptide repeat protein [Bacteroidota bacterium]
MMHVPFRYLTCGLLCCVILSTASIARATPRVATRYLKQLHRQAARQKPTPEVLQVVTRHVLRGTISLLTNEPVAAWNSLQKALRRSPLNAAIHYRLAQLLVQHPQLASKSRNKAETHMHVAMALAPHNKCYYTAAAQIHLQQERYADAIQVYEQMLQYLPSDDNVLLYLAELYTEQQDHRQAIRLYNQIEQRQGMLPNILQQKQYCYLKMNKLDEAVVEGIKLVQTYPNVAAYVIELANLLRDHKQVDRAIEYLQASLKGYPQHRQVRLHLAQLLLNQDHYVAALVHARQLVADTEFPLERKLVLMRAYLQYGRHNGEAALQDVMDTFCKAHPRDVRVLTLCGDLCRQHDAVTLALQYYHQALGSNACYSLWQRVLDMYITEQMPQYLLHAAQEALEQFPDQAMLYYYQGVGYLMQQQYADAAAILALGKLFATTREELERLGGELGNVYNLLQKHDQADACYQSVLDINPDNYVVLNNYSYSLALRRQQLPLARKMSYRLVKACPTCAHYLDTHAWVLYQCGYYKQAKKYSEKALAQAPTAHLGAILEHYGDTLYQLGERQAALAQWAKAQDQPGASDMLVQKLVVQS